MKKIFLLLFTAAALAGGAAEVALWSLGVRIFDTGYLRTDPEFRAENFARFQRWAELLGADDPALPVRELPAGLKFVAELTAAEPYCADRQLQQLKQLREQGFDAIVAVYTGDRALELLGAIDRARQAGFTCVVLAWSPLPETEPATIFPDPETLKRELAMLAASCDAFAVGWRKTSLHFMRLEPGHTAFLVQAVRSGNPEITILGELYGAPCETVRRVNKWRPLLNRPESAAALVAVGYGERPDPLRRAILQELKISDRVLHVVAEGEPKADEISLRSTPINGK